MSERLLALQMADKAAVIMADVVTMCILLPFSGLSLSSKEQVSTVIVRRWKH